MGLQLVFFEKLETCEQFPASGLKACRELYPCWPGYFQFIIKYPYRLIFLLTFYYHEKCCYFSVISFKMFRKIFFPERNIKPFNYSAFRANQKACSGAKVGPIMLFNFRVLIFSY